MADSLESANAYQKAHLGDSKRAEIIAPTVIFLAIAYLAVFFRYKSRRIAGVRLGAEYVFLESLFPVIDRISILKSCIWELVFVKDVSTPCITPLKRTRC